MCVSSGAHALRPNRRWCAGSIDQARSSPGSVRRVLLGPSPRCVGRSHFRRGSSVSLLRGKVQDEQEAGGEAPSARGPLAAACDRLLWVLDCGVCSTVACARILSRQGRQERQGEAGGGARRPVPNTRPLASLSAWRPWRPWRLTLWSTQPPDAASDGVARARQHVHLTSACEQAQHVSGPGDGTLTDRHWA